MLGGQNNYSREQYEQLSHLHIKYLLAALAFGLLLCKGSRADTDTTSTNFTELTTKTSNELRALVEDEPLRRFKRQAIQRLAISAGSLTDDSLSSKHRWFETEIGTAIPLGSFENILATSVLFRNDALEVPALGFERNDLYELSVSFFLKKPLSRQSNLLINIRPSYLGDLQATDHAFGMFGMALVTKELEFHDLTLSYGVVHLNQLDIGILPAVGLRWEPNPEINIDLRFPESTISWRLAKDLQLSEHWLHVSLGFGGNRWGIRDAVRTDSKVQLKYWSATITLEQIVAGGGGWWIHLSYQFARRFVNNASSEFELGNGFQIAAELAY